MTKTKEDMEQLSHGGFPMKWPKEALRTIESMKSTPLSAEELRLQSQRLKEACARAAYKPCTDLPGDK